MTDAALSAKGTRLNRRGLETRRHLLDVAVQCLAAGGPEAVSANLVAKEAGATWVKLSGQNDVRLETAIEAVGRLQP